MLAGDRLLLDEQLHQLLYRQPEVRAIEVVALKRLKVRLQVLPGRP